MPVLVAWVASETRTRPTPVSQALLVALVFSFLGDVFLMIPGDLFLWGLGSFLVGHLAYIVAFWMRPPGAPRPTEVPRGGVSLMLPIHFYAAATIAYLLPHLGDMRTPVLLYLAVIFAMGLTSVLRRGRVSSRSFWPVYAGACTFMVSDSIIALDRFVEPVPYGQVLIM
ncbi:MAG: lysoplasmalogenase, partial [Candidatus Binatia bacterium]